TWTSASGQKITKAVAPAIAMANASRARNRTRSASNSELRRTGRARIGDRIADVGQPAHVHHQPFEAEAEAGMRHRAVAAEVAVPAVMRRVQAELGHARVQHVQPLLALAAADDL